MTTIENMIADFATRRYELAKAIAPNPYCTTIEGAGYIVVVEDFPMTYDIEETNGQRLAVNPTLCSPEKARRFTLRDAARVAADTKNGNGTRGVAVHWMEAVEQQIAKLDELIETLQQKEG